MKSSNSRRVRFPGVADDSHSYSVEFRPRDGWDRGIPRAAVLIHEYHGGLSRLVRADGGPEWLQGETFVGQNRVRITIDRIDLAESTATVTVTY